MNEYTITLTQNHELNRLAIQKFQQAYRTRIEDLRKAIRGGYQLPERKFTVTRDLYHGVITYNPVNNPFTEGYEEDNTVAILDNEYITEDEIERLFDNERLKKNVIWVTPKVADPSSGKIPLPNAHIKTVCKWLGIQLPKNPYEKYTWQLHDPLNYFDLDLGYKSCHVEGKEYDNSPSILQRLDFKIISISNKDTYLAHAYYNEKLNVVYSDWQGQKLDDIMQHEIMPRDALKHLYNIDIQAPSYVNIYINDTDMKLYFNNYHGKNFDEILDFETCECCNDLVQYNDTQEANDMTICNNCIEEHYVTLDDELVPIKNIEQYIENNLEYYVNCSYSHVMINELDHVYPTWRKLQHSRYNRSQLQPLSTVEFTTRYKQAIEWQVSARLKNASLEDVDKHYSKSMSLDPIDIANSMLIHSNIDTRHKQTIVRYIKIILDR